MSTPDEGYWEMQNRIEQEKIDQNLRDLAEIYNRTAAPVRIGPVVEEFPTVEVGEGSPFIGTIERVTVGDVEEAVELMRAEDHEPTDVLVRAAADVEAGQLVTFGHDAVVVGVALGDGRMLVHGQGRVNTHTGSIIGGGFATSMNDGNFLRASMAYGGPYWGLEHMRERRQRVPQGQRVDEPPQYKYTERFPKEVEAKAMELLRKFMSEEQYAAFVDRADIELLNKAGTHRLIINQNGSFKLLKGDPGAGIQMTSGNVRSHKYPLGDEIAAFLDWFRYRTDDLIKNWRCGNFGIVEDRLVNERYVDDQPTIGAAVEALYAGVGAARGFDFLGAAMAQLVETSTAMAEALERIFGKGR